jgi:hypothetical protein
MMKIFNRFLSILTVCVILVIPTTGQAQVCGDLNGDDQADAADWTLFVEYLLGVNDIDPTNFEFDERFGNTAGDAWVWVNILESNRSWAPCNPTMDYGYTVNLKDTVFIPYMSHIPSGKNAVSLPVASTVEDSSATYYLPMLFNAAGSNGTFELVDVSVEITNGSHGELMPGDTVILFGTEWFIGYGGNQMLSFLNYTRAAPGDGAIFTELVDRGDPLLYSIGRMLGPLSIDLYRPVVVPVNVSYPIGDCNGDMRLDISDITCFVGWMFGHWPVSHEPYLQAYGLLINDTTCDGWVDIADLVFFVDYLFGGGPPPCSPFGL